jgi:hypothetical protein
MKSTIEQVINKLLMFVVFSSKALKPGILLEHLTEEERSILRNAKGKDFWHRIK